MRACECLRTLLCLYTGARGGEEGSSVEANASPMLLIWASSEARVSTQVSPPALSARDAFVLQRGDLSVDKEKQRKKLNPERSYSKFHVGRSTFLTFLYLSLLFHF